MSNFLSFVEITQLHLEIKIARTVEKIGEPLLHSALLARKMRITLNLLTT